MIIAITIWNNRVSPVFDVARSVIVVDIEEGIIRRKSIKSFANDQPEYKASLLKQLQVNTLICGAISTFYAGLISTHRIEIIPFITGDIEDVIKAFTSATLSNPKLMMPGCCKNRRSRQRTSLKSKRIKI